MSATHDFTKPHWGHNVEFLTMSDDGKEAVALVFGPPVDVGDYLIFSNKNSTTRYRVTENLGRGFGPIDMRKVKLVFDPREAK